MRISALNTIKFVTKDSQYLGASNIPTVDAVTYYQRWKKSDVIWYQLIIDDGFGYTEQAYWENLITQERTAVTYVVNGTTTIDTDVFRYYSVDISGLDEGVYRLEHTVTLDDDNGIYYLATEPMWIATAHENTINLRFRPEPDVNGLAFDSYFYPVTIEYNLRLEGGLFPKDVKQVTKDRSIEVEDNTFRIISSDVYKVEKWTFGDSLGIPEWMAQVLNSALVCEYFYINGIRYAKTDGASLERAENIGLLSPYNCELKQYNSIDSTSISPSPVPSSFNDSFSDSFDS